MERVEDKKEGSNQCKDPGPKAGERSQGPPNPFGSFRLSKKSPKKSKDSELSEQSKVGKDDKVEDKKEETNPFDDPEPKAKEKNQGLPNPFGSFRNSKKSVNKSNNSELQSIPEQSKAGKKVQDKKEGTNPFDDPEPNEGEKSQGLSNPFGSFRISKKTVKKSNGTTLQSLPDQLIVGKDYKVQNETEGTNPFDDPEPKMEEKSQGLLNRFGNFRSSKSSIKGKIQGEQRNSLEIQSTVGRDYKDQGEEDGINTFEKLESQVGEKSQGLPELEESPVGPGHIPKSSKKEMKRQDQKEESVSPDKKETFSRIAVRLSKIYKKHENEEEANSPHKNSPRSSTSLINVLKTSKKSKKKIDFNEYEDKCPVQEVKEVDKVQAEEEEKLLSVMEINELIHSRHLSKAFRNINIMEEKLIEMGQGNSYYENITEFTMRAKDVDLLYGSLFNMVRSIVKETLDQEVDESLVADVVNIMENEAIIHKNSNISLENSEITLGQPRRWKHLWKAAVKDSVAKRTESVPLNREDENWLPHHLEKLKINTLKDLMKVKNSLMSLYPEDYKVCSTYFLSFHDALSSHIQKNVVSHASSLSQLYCLLDFIVNTYKSEEFMGNPELRPEMNSGSLPPQLLAEECLQKLKMDYNTALEVIVKKYFQNILEMEKGKWEKEEEVEDEEFKELHLYTDIEQIIGTHVKESSKISEQMEKSAFHSCVEHLGSFCTRLQNVFLEWSAGKCNLLSIQYAVTYINSLIKLRHNTTQSDANQCKVAENNLNTAVEAFNQHIFRIFTEDTKLHFKKLITKEWLKKGTAFNAIIKSAGILCQYVNHLTSPYGKEMAYKVHKYLVKKYIAQIMKRKLKLNQFNRKKAAEKMKAEGNLISSIAEDMGSDREELMEAIGSIAEVIGSHKKAEIRPKLEELYYSYPDVSEGHILCILHLQGTWRNRNLLEHFRKLQKSQLHLKESKDTLFSEIDCAIQVKCF
ncbi:exocyst complex component 3-like protein 4 [Pyxicephalus adspersus]|uniref:exocyst complex component 3-like protein 4 n=1 Tax=Pyxicephalus adspersus TaxID=30357 RepID=UPI003B5B9B8F